MKKNSEFQLKRIIFLLILFLILSFAILSRLIYMQIIKSDEYTKMALEQINRSEEIVSDRGYILDRNKKRLAINTSASTIYVNGQYIEDESVRRIVARELAPIIQSNADEIYNLINTDRRVKVKQWVSSDAAIRIREKALAGVEVVDGFRRFYPYGNLASHLIGFANIDGIGQYGVEASYNDELSGSPGRLFKSSDAGNRQLPNSSMEIFDADDGLSTVLTIDQTIQQKAEEEVDKLLELYQPDRVHIIVQEVESGDILAMNSYPSFDGNNPTAAVNPTQLNQWKTMNSEEIQNDWYTNWRNPSISDIYEPGSTFKLITAAAALEENTSNPDEHYYCTGYIRDIKGAPPLRCVSYDDPHGDITLREALAHSCNPTFVYMNRDTGRENFLKYIKAFGFGEKTGIDLNGEGLGIIPSDADGISELSFATMSYGHGIAVTPIQLINAVSAIGNDGILMKPRVVKELVNTQGELIRQVEISEKRQVVSKETADTLLEMMNGVVEYGTATRANSSMYHIGGKTGTASKVLETGGYAEDKYVSSFVGLAPVEDPKVAVLVIVDNPQNETYGSVVASPTGKNLIEFSLESLNIRPLEDNESDSEDLIEVPDVRYKLIGEGGLELSNLNLKYTTGYDKITEDTIIVGQSINPGELVDSDTVIELELDLNESRNKIIPDFRGKKVEEIEHYLNQLGIKYIIEEIQYEENANNDSTDENSENEELEPVILQQIPDIGERISPDEELILKIGIDENSIYNNQVNPNLRDGLLDNETEILDDNIDASEESDESEENDDLEDSEDDTENTEDTTIDT